MEKLLKICRQPQGKAYTIGLNLKGEYLKKFGFSLDDFVSVKLTKNKIIIKKSEEERTLTEMNRVNPSLSKLIEAFDLTVRK